MEEHNKNTQNDKAWWQPAFFIFLKMSAWIGFPIIIATFVGKWLDKKYDSDPWFFLGLIALSFFGSMFAVVKTALEEFKKIEDEIKK